MCPHPLVDKYALASAGWDIDDVTSTGRNSTNHSPPTELVVPILFLKFKMATQRAEKILTCDFLHLQYFKS